MGLDEYKTKRNFQKTREPEEKESEGTQPIFVVQEHHASHLHYDFRLALDGVLKSWAIPKGIPEEPKVRKLAVQTEDHPLGYEDFEGIIPKGEYGAGEVNIWDKGSFQLKERSPDKLVFVLEGERLKGTYALVRFKGKEKDAKNWLIMKL
jgi:bifunctional non-homologous end joining protein LigD